MTTLRVWLNNFSWQAPMVHMKKHTRTRTETLATKYLMKDCHSHTKTCTHAHPIKTSLFAYSIPYYMTINYTSTIGLRYHQHRLPYLSIPIPRTIFWNMEFISCNSGNKQAPILIYIYEIMYTGSNYHNTSPPSCDMFWTHWPHKKFSDVTVCQWEQVATKDGHMVHGYDGGHTHTHTYTPHTHTTHHRRKSCCVVANCRSPAIY